MMKIFIKDYLAEAIGGFICLIIGLFSGCTATVVDYQWYDTLNKPFFNPPQWIFAPVWTVLYVMLGIFGVILWKKRQTYFKILCLFIAHLFSNFIWFTLFFHYHWIAYSIWDIIFIWLSLIIIIYFLYKEKIMILLLLPYTLWVTFALLLNGAIFYLN